MTDDAQLLHRYSTERSESSFRTLVDRYIDLVFSVALRRTNGNRHDAEEIAQAVFSKMACHAGELSRHPALAAWLHTATRNAALNLMISDQRRKTREKEAVLLARTEDDPAVSWETVQPLLDESIDALSEPDRVAVVQHFLEHRSYAEIGRILRVSEDAARMRTDRALEKLRVLLARRGVTSTASALSAVIANQPLGAAPTELAAQISARVLLLSAKFTATTAAVTFMKTKLVLSIAAAVALAFTAGVYFGNARDSQKNVTPRLPTTQVEAPVPVAPEAEVLRTEVARLTGDVDRLSRANTELSKRLASIPPSQKGTAIGLAPWQIQQAILTNLKQIASARDQFVLEHKRAPNGVEELVGLNSYIKAVRTVAGEGYGDLSMQSEKPLKVVSPDGTVVVYDPAGRETTTPDFPPELLRAQEMSQRLEPSINKAIEAYRSANAGKNPPNEKALLPYFPTPEEGADFVELVDARKKAGM